MLDRPTTIVEMRAGSDLFGTRTETSDTDLVRVQFPAVRDIILQQSRPVDPQSTGARDSRNTAADRDDLVYSLAGFLRPDIILSMRGIETLLSPDAVQLSPPLPIWRRLQEGRPHLLTAGTESHLRYMAAQADSYGIRGSRAAAVVRAIEVVKKALAEGCDPETRLDQTERWLLPAFYNTPHLRIGPLNGRVGSPNIEVVVAGMRFVGTENLMKVRDRLEQLLRNGYPRYCRHWSRSACQDKAGVNLKDLSHAVRVGEQTIELLETGHVTLPRPPESVRHILEIRSGRVAVVEVLEEIEDLMDDIRRVAPSSRLRPRLDLDWIEDFLVTEYGRHIAHTFTRGVHAAV